MATEQPMIINPAKEKLKRGIPITGLAVFESLRPSIYKVVAETGYDIVLVDTEHVMHNLDALTDFLVGARDNGLTPVVTVVAPDRALVSRTLDAGALGIVLSHANTPEQAADLVRWMKYPPAGERGIAPGPNVGYATRDLACYCR